MKKVIKNLKKYLIGFILGISVSGVAIVFASTYFPSNQVTYDNKTSGLESKDVQGAIDELYNECFPPAPPSAGDSILENVEVVTSGDGLYKDEYEEGRYFYKGASVNNYVTFNNETWRIISIEPDKTIKIMRDASVSNQYWDTSGSNNWARPASLNTYLNETYLNGMTSTAQSQIVAKDFSIGAVTFDNNDLADQINDENSSKWNGKVALITVSEYIRSNSNQSNCGTFSKNNDNYRTCQNSSWMYIDDSWLWWTLSPRAGAPLAASSVESNGSVNSGAVDSAFLWARPTLYISSDVQITGGDGSSSSPYTLG